MRKSLLSLVPVFALALMLSGCISSLSGGNAYSPEKVSENLVRGVTTKEQVRQIYGEPTTIALSKKGDTWTYIDEPSAGEKVAGQTATAAGVTALGLGSAKAGMAAQSAGGGVVGAVATSTAVNSAGAQASTAVIEQTNRARTTLTIKFDKNGLVKDYTLR